MSSSVVAGVNVEEISKHLNCAVCDKLIRSPKLLPCLHSFCQQCLEELAKNNDGFQCPQCQTEILLSQDEVGSLPGNFFLDNLLDIALINSRGTETVPCTNCDLNAKAKSRCVDCGEFLCGDCYNVHKRIRQTKDHRVLTITELLTSETGKVLHRLSYCNQHTTEELKYFCDSCNIAVCRDCLIVEHRQHKYDYINESKKVKKVKASVEVLFQETLPIISSIDKTNTEIQSVRDTLHGRLGTVKTEIRAMTTQLIKRLKEREHQLLFNADQIFNSKVSILEQQSKELRLTHMKFKTACDFTEQLLNYANEVEMFLLKEPIKERLTELSKMEISNKPRERGDIRYEVDDIHADQAIVQALGKLKTYGELDEQPGCNDVERDDKIPMITKTLQPSTSNCISVDIKTSNGEPLSVDHVVDGQTSMRCTPAFEGIYSLAVQACGQHITNLQIDFKTTNAERKIYVPSPRERSAKQTFAGSGGKFGKLSDPQDVAVDNNGHVIVSDSRNHRIQVFDISGKFLNRFGTLGTGDGQLQSPNGVAVNKDGNIVVSDTINNRMQVFTFDGKHVKTFGKDDLHHPSGVAVDKDGRVIVVDRGNARVAVFDGDGSLITSFGSLGNGKGHFNCPSHVTVNSQGHIIVSDFGNDRIQVFSSSGTFMFRFGESGRENGEFNWPTGVAVNQFDQIIVSDSYNHRMQIFHSDGTFESQFGNEGEKLGEFKRPAGLATTDTGSIVIADWGNDRIQVF